MKKKNNDGKIVLILIIALIAFAIGASIGINLSLHGLDSVDNNETHEINVTDNMTSNPNSGYTIDISEEDVNYDTSKSSSTT